MEFTQRADHKNWSAKRKDSARTNAARLGKLQNFIMATPVYPVAVFVLIVLAFGVIGAIETRM